MSLPPPTFSAASTAFPTSTFKNHFSLTGVSCADTPVIFLKVWFSLFKILLVNYIFKKLILNGIKLLILCRLFVMLYFDVNKLQR